jgi:hypothetical protein
MATRLTRPTDTDGGLEQTSLPAALLQELVLALRSIRYGTVELVIHDGRVVQLEKREKVRLQTDLTQPSNSISGSGATLSSPSPDGRPDRRKPPTSSSREIDV